MPRFVVLSPVRVGGKTVRPNADDPAVVELSARDGRDLLALGAVEPAPEAEPKTEAPKAPAKRAASRKTSAAAEKAAAEKAAGSGDAGQTGEGA